MTNVRVYTRPETEPQAQDYPNVAAAFVLQQAEDEACEHKTASVVIDGWRSLDVWYHAGLPQLDIAPRFTYELWDGNLLACGEQPWRQLRDRAEAVSLLAACIEGGAS